jgi:hypothetical protein
VPNRPAFLSVALAGAAAIGASLIAVTPGALPGPTTQTRAVALTAGDTEVFLPDTTTFEPSVAEGFPPFDEVLQGTETWNMADPSVQLIGTDTQTTLGSFVNDDFLVSDGFSAVGHVPSPGSEIDLANFGGGFENEYADLDGGRTITDTLITPFGNYTIPLASTVTENVAAAAPADGFSDLISSVQYTIGAADKWFSDAGTDFAQGYYPLALSEELAGVNNLTVGVSNDLLTNGYAALTGDGGNFGYDLENPPQPMDFATGLAEAQSALGNIQMDLSLAMTDFGSGDTYSGLVDLGSVATNSASATDAIILGLFDSRPGMMFTS